MTSSTQGVAELLPCPFCGSEDLTVYQKSDIGSWVACVSCGLETPTETGVSPEEAVKYWNTRPSPGSKPEAYRKALKSASDQCSNVIFNCEQRPADNDRRLQSWRGVKEYIDAVLSASNQSEDVK